MRESAQSAGRNERNMASRANRMLTVAIIWIVIVFGCYFFTVAFPGLGTKWERLSPIPERAITIELTDFGLILAATESSNVYRRGLWANEPWKLYDEVTEDMNATPCQLDDQSRFSVSSPPGKVVARSSRNCVVSAENSAHVEVALLENGEVWLWTYLYGGIGGAFTPLLLLAGGALGVILLGLGGIMKFWES